MRPMSAFFRLALFAAVACTGVSSAVTTVAQTTAPPAQLESMPKWSEFPALPTDVPTAADIKSRVMAEQARQKLLTAEVAALVWDRQEPDQIHADLTGRIDLKYTTPIDTVMTPEQLEAVAAALRARAAPPPVAN